MISCFSESLITENTNRQNACSFCNQTLFFKEIPKIILNSKLPLFINTVKGLWKLLCLCDEFKQSMKTV